MQDIQFKEYINEIPLNTVRNWGQILQKNLPWEYVGWSGEPKEPYRHWACYPEFNKDLKLIWDTLNYSFKEDGLRLRPERIIGNLFSHGDSCWLHQDCQSNTAWTTVLYLNDMWDINWGGETIIAEGNEIIKSFAPTPGKFIIFKSNLVHGPRPVSREAPFPRFGLTFQCESDKDLSGLSSVEVPAVSNTKL